MKDTGSTTIIEFLESANTLLKNRRHHFANLVSRSGCSSLEQMNDAGHPNAIHANFLRYEAIVLADKISAFIASIEELQKLGL